MALDLVLDAIAEIFGMVWGWRDWVRFGGGAGCDGRLGAWVFMMVVLVS